MRTVRNFVHSPVPQRMGRPAFAPTTRWRALSQVRRVLKAFGWDLGWLTISHLLPTIPTMLVQKSLRAWKIRHRADLRARALASRTSLHVLTSQTMMGQDAYQQTPVHAEAIKDFANLRYEAVAAGAPAKDTDIVDGLESLKAAGKLPLVWATDNGGAYRSDIVLKWLADNMVVDYPSRRHTPRDNAPTERCVRELKSACLLKGDASPLDNAHMLAEKVRLLNSCLPRRSKGFRTANEVDSSMHPWYRFVDRKVFFKEVTSAKRLAACNGYSGHKARKAEREAVQEVLVRFGLARLNRGDGCLAQGNRK